MSPYNYNPSNDRTSTPSGSYTYDANGNTLADASGKSTTSTPSGSYTYDANGNTLADASGKSYTWDWRLNSSGLDLCALVLVLFACVGLAGCGSMHNQS